MSGGPELSAWEWWASRRFRYNAGLVLAGILAFCCYTAVVFWGGSTGALPDAEINILTIGAQGLGYLFMMGIANLCYGIGPYLEEWIQPARIERYRRVAY